MLTIEIKVNGQLVAAISAARISTQLPAGDHDYAAQAFEFGQFEPGQNLKKTSQIKAGAFYARHQRKEGILKLASILCAHAGEKLRGEE